ncbi:septum formation family protein [Streptomyces avermitilis]|uniref:serine/threonine-protein kinase n=1 Tax=Streptomyces avermitilis TaxID=33903 RepID=UPI0033D593BD
MPSGSPQSGVGRVIADRYLLLNRLGSGGMGHVWLAHDQRLACEVALKEIVFRSPAEAGQERTARVARARAEARHAAGLRGHPHVVTVHDVLEHEGLPWIVMEYVAGALDLRDLVRRRGPLAPAECARIGLAVLDALTAGHERGIMHRDVKPANILLAPDRTGAAYTRVLLTDYGISVQPDAGETRYTLTSALVGTPGYLAPERATGGQPTASADLFSLGCTLYFGVEGCGPFERDTHLAEVTAVVLEEPRPPVRAGALEPVLAAMLAKDPGQRITAEDTEAALSAIVTPQPHPRTQFDLGSQPPWAEAGWTTETGYPRQGPGAAPGGNGTSGAYGPGGTGSGAGSAPTSPPPGATAGTAGQGTPSEPGPVRGPTAGPSSQGPNAAPYAYDPNAPSYGQEPGAPRPGPAPTASPYGQSPAAAPYAHDPTPPPYGQNPAATPYGHSPDAPSHGQNPAAPPYSHDSTAPSYGQNPAAPPYGQGLGASSYGSDGIGRPAGAAFRDGGFRSGRRRRRRPRVLRAFIAFALGLVLALGGVWYAVAHLPPGGGDAKPYGAAVALAAPLKDGDCVVADWPGAAFQGTPKLAVDPTCAEKVPDGQVMAVVAATSADAARQHGPAACEQRTQEIREKLADVRGYAVVPTRAGFEAAGRRTACLVLGAHGAVYGPLDRHRTLGMWFVDTANMQKRDCLDAPSLRRAQLVSCTGPHDQQVLGFTRLGAGTTLKNAAAQSDAACARDVPPAQYGYDPGVYEAASWAAKGAWQSGTHVVVCSVQRQNGGTMEGTEP